MGADIHIFTVKNDFVVWHQYRDSEGFRHRHVALLMFPPPTCSYWRAIPSEHYYTTQQVTYYLEFELTLTFTQGLSNYEFIIVKPEEPNSYRQIT